MKKYLPIIVVSVAIFLIVFLAFGALRKPKTNSETDRYATPAPYGKSLDTLPENQRPKVSIRPRGDNRALIVTFSNLKNFVTLQYELSYLTKDEIPQGVIGTPISLSGEDEIEKELVLGTCSGTVTLKCRYDEEVHQITLSVKYLHQNGDTYDQIVEYSL